jgi:hypothetical protein
MIIFKCVRKPWLGIVIKEEQYQLAEKDKLLESVSYYEDFTQINDGTRLGER